ncbi:MAG: hypothetical protein WAX04_01940 [Oscillospiraceae bacterium]
MKIFSRKQLTLLLLIAFLVLFGSLSLYAKKHDNAVENQKHPSQENVLNESSDIQSKPND